MAKIKKNRVLLFMLILSLISFPIAFFESIVLAAKDAKTKKTPPPMVKCYQRVRIDIKESSVDELKQNLKDLDNLYNQKKINKETYEQRKKDIQTQVKELEKY